ncbi:MAG: redoxin domain-containing protein, partial [Anaerolineales bacterium]
MDNNYDALQQAGAEAVAVVVASLATVEEWCQGFKVQYPMLADVNHQVSEAYAVYNLFDNGLAGPAV